MRIPAIAGLIRRRVLLNYRVSPEIAQAIIPPVFRPKLIGEYAIAGICLIRLEQIRPNGLPAWVGIASENFAHRIAVEWEDEWEPTNRIPAAVEITLYLEPLEKGDRPVAITRAVGLPVAPLSWRF